MLTETDREYHRIRRLTFDMVKGGRAKRFGKVKAQRLADGRFVISDGSRTVEHTISTAFDAIIRMMAN